MARPIDKLSIELQFKDAGSQAVIEKLRGSLKRLEMSASGVEPNIKGLRDEILSQGRASVKSVSNINAQLTALKALRDEAKIGGKAFKQLTADIKKLDAQMAKGKGGRPGGQRGGRALAATQAAGAVISGGIFGGPEGAAGGLIGLGLGGVPGAFAGAAIGAQIGMIRQSLGGVAETVAEINSMKIALAGVSESAEDYKKSFDSVISISEQFLFPVDKAIGEFTRLKAAVVGAGFGTKETTDVFKGFAAAILATGGNSEKLSGALLAASQVFSKGKVQAEELRGQIGERLPGAFTTFSQSIGVSSRQLDDMLRKGEVSTENFVEFTRTLFSRYSETAETLASSPEKAGQRLQLALSMATLEYGGFFQKVGAGFQDYLTKLVNFAVKNKETFKKVAADVSVFAQDVKTVVKGLVSLVKEAFGGMFVFIGKALKVFVEQFIAPFFNAIVAGINLLASRVKLGQAERKIGIRRAGEIRIEELDALKKEQGITAVGRLGTSIQQNDEIERRAQARILEEAGMAPKAREDRFAAALKGLDKAFEVFTPSSGFGTSLGDQPDLTGSGSGSGLRAEDAKALDRRRDAAAEIVRKLGEALNLSKAQNEVEKLLAKQSKERSDLEARFAKLQKDGVDTKIQEQQKDAEGLLLQKQKAELTAQTNKLGQKTIDDITKITDKIKEKFQSDKEYQRLLAEGISPELAKQLVAIDKQFAAGDKLLQQRILDFETQLKKTGLSDQEVKNIKEQIALIEEKRKLLGQTTEQARQDATTYTKEKSNFETFKETFKAGIEEMGNLYENLGAAAANAFSGMADTVADFVTTGTANFKEFAASVLSDLSRILIRFAFFQAIKGFGLFADGGVVKGMTPPTTLPDGVGAVAAKGLAIGKNGIMPFAKGGIVTKPTLFKYASGGSGRFGLMGEAGAEAIMPLRRGRNGKLGVESSGGVGNVVVNVDASGSNVQADQPNAKALGSAIGAAVQAELIKQKRPGGLLS